MAAKKRTDLQGEDTRVYSWAQAESRRAAAISWTAGGNDPEPLSGDESSMIAFSIPDPDTLPLEDLIQSNERVIRRAGRLALQYGGPQGYPGLREWLAFDINAREGVDATNDNVVLTCGSSGAVENLCEALIDPGDVVFVERPTFPGSLRTITACLAEIVGIPTNRDGLDPDDLERAIAETKRAGRRPKLFYTQSNFHNPTAATMSLARRRRVIDVCRAENVLIAQDDAYGALGFDGQPPPSLYALAGGDGVVLIGTFSKALATGLRVGWIMGDKTVIDAITRVRFDMGVSPWTSRVLADYCERGLFDKHVHSMIDVYRRKRDAMEAALTQQLPILGRRRTPQGGFFLWIELPETVDPRKLYAAAWEEGVGYVDGRAFFDNGEGGRFVRACVSAIQDAAIPDAMRRLERAVERASR